MNNNHQYKDRHAPPRSAFNIRCASMHSDCERSELDYYATDPAAVEALLKYESFSSQILEPCCGGGHISEVLRKNRHFVYSFDIVQRDYKYQNGVQDFLEYFTSAANDMDIITNPPYSHATEFAMHALDISMDGVKVAMFLKLTFLESVKRKKLFDVYPPKKVYVFRNRIDCWPNGVKPAKMQRAVCYAWYVWEKGFYGDPIIKWID